MLLSSLGEATSGFGATRVDVNESVVYSTGDRRRRHRLSSAPAIRASSTPTRRASCASWPSSTPCSSSSLADGPGRHALRRHHAGRARLRHRQDGKVRESWPSSTPSTSGRWPTTRASRRSTPPPARPGGSSPSTSRTSTGPPSARRDRLLYDTGEKHLLSLAARRRRRALRRLGRPGHPLPHRPDRQRRDGAGAPRLRRRRGARHRPPRQRRSTSRSTSSSAAAARPRPTSTGPNAPRGTKMVLPTTPPDGAGDGCIADPRSQGRAAPSIASIPTAASSSCTRSPTATSRRCTSTATATSGPPPAPTAASISSAPIAPSSPRSICPSARC